MIDPDYFGCSAKLTYSETRSLVEASGSGSVDDFSRFGFANEFVASVDRISRCASDWAKFANIAVNHALADIEVAFAIPLHAVICFEFGPDANMADRSVAAQSFRQAVLQRGMTLGKCHSALSNDPTSVVISVIGTIQDQILHTPVEGKVFLNRPLGLFKLHYMEEMGLLETESTALSAIFQPRFVPEALKNVAVLSDVSGHGLGGSLASLAHRFSLDLDISIHSRLAAASEVLMTDIDCLQNARETYGSYLEVDNDSAWPLISLRETAGPMLALVESSFDIEPGSFGTGYCLSIGTFRRGSGKVIVRWQE